MKLYYAPGACSLAVHIALREAGTPFELEKVDLRARRTESGRDYLEINPKGPVPALELDDGEILTEAAVCLQYVADLAPAARLAPLAGTMARYRLMEWLNYVSSELHKTFSPLFRGATAERREEVVRLLSPRFDFVSRRLGERDFLLGTGFTVADAYLYVVLGWTRFLHVDIAPWPALGDFLARAGRRGPVQDARKAEGLA
jgi:glutathione S-transferase